MSVVRSLLFSLSMGCICLLGCDSSGPDDQPAVGDQQRSTVAVLLIDETDLGPVITRQWRARTEDDIQISEIDFASLAESKFAAVKDFDVVIYPAYRIGEMAEAGLIDPVRKNYLDAPDFNRRELLRFDRDELVSWGQEIVAVSLGGPLPVLLCRADVLKQLDAEPPTTWHEFSELAERIRSLNSDNFPNRVGVPLQGHWASYSLAIRAASAIRSRGKYSSFFDVADMRPLIGSEPFLRALQGWDRDLEADFQSWTPQNVLQAYARGELVMAVTPINAHWWDDQTVNALPETIVAPIPGSEQLFDESRGGWVPRSSAEDISVATIATEGLLASVTSETQRTRTAYRFLFWLGEKKISSVIAPESPHTGMSRKSHLANPKTWIGGNISDEAARQYSDVIRRANENALNLISLRMPGRDQYLQQLDDVVMAVLSGKANAVEALDELVTAWDRTTDQLGRDAQRAAYRKSQGLTGD